MSENLVLYETSRDIAVLTLNRPEKRNALNIPLLEALCKAIEDAHARQARIIFCAARAPYSTPD